MKALVEIRILEKVEGILLLLEPLLSVVKAFALLAVAKNVVVFSERGCNLELLTLTEEANVAVKDY